jgi:hypothetical protein
MRRPCCYTRDKGDQLPGLVTLPEGSEGWRVMKAIFALMTHVSITRILHERVIS